VIRERQNDVAAAIECFERVVAANPRDASAHDHLGGELQAAGSSRGRAAASPREAPRESRRRALQEPHRGRLRQVLMPQGRGITAP